MNRRIVTHVPRRTHRALTVLVSLQPIDTKHPRSWHWRAWPINASCNRINLFMSVQATYCAANKLLKRVVNSHCSCCLTIWRPVLLRCVIIFIQPAVKYSWVFLPQLHRSETGLPKVLREIPFTLFFPSYMVYANNSFDTGQNLDLKTALFQSSYSSP